MLLIAVCQVGVVVGLRYFHGIEDRMVTGVTVLFATVCVGTPIVGFGQMQYRRARQAYFNSVRLTEQLIAARDEARAANAEKSRFLASMSHELRTPLNAIIGFSEILRDETFGQIAVRRYVEYARDIHKSGHHLLSLINDILDLSKIEFGQQNIRKDAAFSLSPVIREICDMMRITAQKYGVDLSVSLPKEDIRISADERMIWQILLNLISNAIKFTPENGRILVRLGVEPSGINIAVADSGIGMTPQEQIIALQPFGQVDSFQARKHSGTGLGLTLVKAMVELHGGAMGIRSAPGEGTTVSFSIPMSRFIRPDPAAAKLSAGLNLSPLNEAVAMALRAPI